MSKLMKTTHDATTGEIVVREMTSAEIAQYEADVIQAQVRKAEQAAKDAAKQAVLDKLGLSADEVAALLG
jgi:hypothetical protein